MAQPEPASGDVGKLFNVANVSGTESEVVEFNLSTTVDRAAEESHSLGGEVDAAAFARYLVKRITAVPSSSGAYSLHIYGPWGAGKSTLLNFMHEELKNTNKWLVAEFNAWRHQHIRPPWWSMIESVFQQTKQELGFWDRLREYWWRFIVI